jgi:hypothetical protein
MGLVPVLPSLPSSACACQNCVTAVLRKSKNRHGQYINAVYKLALRVSEPPVSAFASITHHLPSPSHFHLHTTCNTRDSQTKDHSTTASPSSLYVWTKTLTDGLSCIEIPHRHSSSASPPMFCVSPPHCTHRPPPPYTPSRIGMERRDPHEPRDWDEGFAGTLGGKRVARLEGGLDG